jgi:hypothetical protein
MYASKLVAGAGVSGSSPLVGSLVFGDLQESSWEKSKGRASPRPFDANPGDTFYEGEDMSTDACVGTLSTGSCSSHMAAPRLHNRRSINTHAALPQS